MPSPDNFRLKTLTDVDRYYLSIAQKERKRSDDPNAIITPMSGVGAVIASKAGIISKSANVLPPLLKKIFDDRGLTVAKNQRYFIIEHAERAAIYSALTTGADLTMATMYCTRFPCSDCARAIIWSGLKRAVFSNGFDSGTQWRGAQQEALKMLRLSGVTVRILPD